MRILFYYLLVINLLYAGWQYLQPSQALNGLPPLADDLATLELLNDSGSGMNESDAMILPGGHEGSTVEPDVSESLKALKQVELACYTLGPFNDEGILQQTRESLADVIQDINVRVLEESEKHRYWVYIPSLPTRSQAKAVARKLKAAKLKDFYIVLRGDTKNSISLGHFKEPAYANRRAKKISDLGLNASIEVIYRKYNVYWLDYRVQKDDVETEAIVNDHVSEDISRINRNCE